MNKTETVKCLIKDGSFKNALKIASNFTIGITKEEKDIMKRAYECYLYPEFYKQLGKDINIEKEKGIIILNKLYGSRNV